MFERSDLFSSNDNVTPTLAIRWRAAPRTQPEAQSAKELGLKMENPDARSYAKLFVTDLVPINYARLRARARRPVWRLRFQFSGSLAAYRQQHFFLTGNGFAKLFAGGSLAMLRLR